MSGSAVGIVVCLCVLLLGLVPLRISRRRIGLAHALETTPVVPLKDAREGPLATSGTVEAAGDVHLISAITGMKCVYWEVIVDEDNGGDIERLASQRTGVNVRLSDDGVTCDIDFTGARVTKDQPFEAVSDQHAVADGIRAFLKLKMGFLNRPRSLKSLRFRETMVEVGHRVTVYGTAVKNAAGRLAFSGRNAPLFICLGTTKNAVHDLRHDARLYRQAAFTIWAIGSTGLAAFLWQHGLA